MPPIHRATQLKPHTPFLAAKKGWLSLLLTTAIQHRPQ